MAEIRWRGRADTPAEAMEAIAAVKRAACCGKTDRANGWNALPGTHRLWDPYQQQAYMQGWDAEDRRRKELTRRALAAMRNRR